MTCISSRKETQFYFISMHFTSKKIAGYIVLLRFAGNNECCSFYPIQTVILKDSALNKRSMQLNFFFLFLYKQLC